MASKALSDREEEIVSLCITGLTNEGIAHKLGISVGTVNTYWMRIKLKIGGTGRTEIVARLVKDRSETALSEAKAEGAGIEAVVRAGIDFLIHEREADTFSRRATLTLLEAVNETLRVTFWASDKDLNVQIVPHSDGFSPSFGPPMTIGQSIYDIFRSRDPANPAIACHLNALNGVESTVELLGKFKGNILRVSPVRDEDDEILGCFSVLNSTSPQSVGSGNAQGDH